MLSLPRAIACPVTLPLLQSARDERVAEQRGSVPGGDSLCPWVTAQQLQVLLGARRVPLVSGLAQHPILAMPCTLSGGCPDVLSASCQDLGHARVAGGRHAAPLGPLRPGSGAGLLEQPCCKG